MRLSVMVLLLLTVCPAAAQDISGIVQDDVGPIAGATVRIQSMAFSATTDARGRFTTIAKAATVVRVSSKSKTTTRERQEGLRETDDRPAVARHLLRIERGI